MGCDVATMQEQGDSESDSGQETDDAEGDEFDEVQLRDKPQHVMTHDDEAFLEACLLTGVFRLRGR